MQCTNFDWIIDLNTIKFNNEKKNKLMNNFIEKMNNEIY